MAKNKGKYNLENNKFGSWTVLYRLKERKNNHTYWRCKCDCGHEYDVDQTSLIAGKSTRCVDCNWKDKLYNDKHIGEVLGNITIKAIDMEYYYKNKRKKYIWECGCGNKFSSFYHNIQKLSKCKICKEKELDLNGNTFGRLMVLSEIRDSSHYRHYLCMCECGNKCDIRRSDLLSGKTKSCGCLKYENKASLTHGLTKTRIHNIWTAMKQRCYYKKSKNFQNYGGRGITVCEEWKDDFIKFYNWAMTNGYNDKLSIDRIDVNGNYEPNNCRWATDIEQGRNKTINRYIEYNGEIKTLVEWSECLKINYSTLRTKTKKYSLEDIIKMEGIKYEK